MFRVAHLFHDRFGRLSKIFGERSSKRYAPMLRRRHVFAHLLMLEGLIKISMGNDRYMDEFYMQRG